MLTQDEHQIRRYKAQKKWRKANPEKNRHYAKEYAKNNKDKRNAAQRKRYAKSPEEREKHLAWARIYRYRKKYGITVETANEMLLAQHGLCAVCKTEINGKNIHVDHCHSTGKVRKLLCQRCNMALGCADDNPERLEAMAVYIRQHR